MLERIATIADEAFGPFPVQTVEQNLTAIEQGIFDQRMRIAELERELARRDPEPRTSAPFEIAFAGEFGESA